jgi:hypothetical protein
MSTTVTYQPLGAAPHTRATPPSAARIHFDPISANGFFVTLKEKVDAYLKDKPNDGGLFVVGKAAFYLALALALYLLVLFGEFSGSLTLALAVGAGVSTILMAINAGHAAHTISFRVTAG